MSVCRLLLMTDAKVPGGLSVLPPQRVEDLGGRAIGGGVQLEQRKQSNCNETDPSGGHLIGVSHRTLYSA